MNPRRSARLAVIATAATIAAHVAAAIFGAQAIASPLPPLEKPISVRFQLSDGVRVAGEMTACDDDGFDGSFGRRRWTDLQFDDAWKLHQRVMDDQDADDWINLGRVMLALSPTQPGAAAKAETAFRRALQLNARLADEVERVRDEVSRAQREARDAARRSEDEKLTTLSPESGPTMRPGSAPWSANVWPTLSEDDLASAVLTVTADADRILKQSGVTIAPVETAHFLIYSELERPQTADWAIRLERVLVGLEFVLNPGFDPSAKDKPIQIQPWGKIIVFIWKRQDGFKMVEAESFKHLVPNESIAVCHFLGPRAFINCWRDDDEEAFEWSLITETVHALMHRCGTPRRLPAWANEGLAEMVASRANKRSILGRDRRKLGVDAYRLLAPADVNALLDLKYENGSFPDPKSAAAPVGGLLLELMMNEKPQKLVNWIVAVKTGKDWVAAMKEDYGSPREEVVGIAVQYYKVND